MVHVYNFIGFGMIHVILLIPPLYVEMFSSERWCLQSKTRNYTPWCKRQGNQEERSQCPRRPPPAALHCKPQGHQSHPVRKKHRLIIYTTGFRWKITSKTWMEMPPMFHLHGTERKTH